MALPYEPKCLLGNIEDYFTIESKLGHGSFGTVYRGITRELGKKHIPGIPDLVAVKDIRIKDMTAFRDFLFEMNILKHSNIPGVIKYYGCFEPDIKMIATGVSGTGRFKKTEYRPELTKPHGNKAYIVIELFEGISMEDWIAHPAELEDIKLAKYPEFIADIATALHELHKLGIVHRDIKPGNIMISVTDDTVRTALVDFGISCFSKTRTAHIGDVIPPENTRGCNGTSMIGTPGFMPPKYIDMFRDATNTIHMSFQDMIDADWWAFGQTIYYMYGGVQDNVHEIKAGDYSRIGTYTKPSYTDSAIAKLLRSFKAIGPDFAVLLVDTLMDPTAKMPSGEDILRTLGR